MVQGISFDGLASGMQTDEIVNQLMELERAPIRRLEQQKEDYQETRDVWRDVNMRLKNLEDALSPLRFSSTFASRQTTSSEETVATATATREADTGNYQLDVTTAAEAHRVASDAQADTTSELGLAGEIEINGKTVSIQDDYSLEDIRGAIDGTLGIGVRASIVGTTLVLEATETGIENEIQVKDDGDVLVTLGILAAGEPEDLALQATAEAGASSVADGFDIQDIINGNTNPADFGAGNGWQNHPDDEFPHWAQVTFQDGGGEDWPVRIDRIALHTTEPAAEEGLRDFDVHYWDHVRSTWEPLTSVRDNEEKVIQLDFDTVETERIQVSSLDTNDGETSRIVEIEAFHTGSQFKNELVTAEDARLTINGVPLQSADNVIDDAVKGMTFEVHTTGESTITVTRDLDQPVEAAEAFVEQFNSTYGFMREQGEYDPDTEIAGPLQGEGTLMRLISGVRRELMDTVALDEEHNAYRSLSAVGFSIDREGRMELDQTKFRAALQQNPEDVRLLFAADDHGAVEGEGGVDGVAVRLNRQLNSYLRTGGILHNRDQMQLNQMRRIDRRIANLEDRMLMRETSLRRQFVELERVLAEFNSQANWLEGQIANLGGYERG